MRILLTGATGFVGRGLLERMSTLVNLELIAAVRGRPVSGLPEHVESPQIAGLDVDTDWRKALEGIEAVIHSAACVHVMHDEASDSLAEFRKVNGEGTPVDAPYIADAQPAPAVPYGISKMEAEQGLRALAAETAMEVVIICPTLVYGPGVKANFLSMMHWLYKGLPLPFGAIHNRRSLVALDNLVDLIVTCIDHPAAANQTFLVSDGEDLSTTELLRKMGAALGTLCANIPETPSHDLIREDSRR